MRRLLTLLALPLLLVAGCGDGEPNAAETSQSAATNTDLASVEVAGAEGEKPTVEFEAPFATDATDRVVLREGDGAPVAPGQKVTVEYLAVNGRDATEFDTSYGRSPATFILDEATVIKGFATGLDGVNVGSRVLVAVAPDDGYGPQGGVPDAGIEAEDTLLFVIDVTAAADVLDRAAGTPVAPPAGLPTVTLAEDGAPTITVPETPAPTELVVQPLITGTGPTVEAGQQITVHYTGVKWPGGEQFDSSWERGAPATFPIGSGGVIPGWDAGLVGQPVGSQVLLVVPPEQGYGEQGNPQGGISGTDTLVFVVDILDAAAEG